MLFSICMNNSNTFQSLVPNLMVEDIKKTVEYYQKTLGFSIFMLVSTEKETDMEVDENKEYMFAMLRKNEVEIMLQTKESLSEDVPTFSEKEVGGSVSLYIRVNNVDDLYKVYRGKVNMIKDIETAWYGVREFFIRDINGYILGFAQEMQK